MWVAVEMTRKHVIVVVLALMACGFLVGWIVASGSSRAPEPLTGSPYGSTRVGEVPVPEPFFITPLGKTPPPIMVLPKDLREYTECLVTNGKPRQGVRVMPQGSVALPCEKLPDLKK